MTSPRLRRIKLTALLVGAAGLGACVAPILTVPPPGASEIAFSSKIIADVDGGVDGGAPRRVWNAKGGPLPSAALATYYLDNRALGSGVIATALADGSFTSGDMEGTDGDPIQIYYVTPAGNYSESICVLLTDDSSPPPVCPE